MQLVIDIPEEVRVAITRMGLRRIPDDMVKIVDMAIQSGTSLPEGHGRIVDADTIALVDEDFVVQSDYIVAECAVKNAPTIIE